MTIRELSRRGVPSRQIALTLGVSEGAVRYHLRREREGAVDGRSLQRPLAAEYRGVIDAWLAAREEQESALNLAALHEHLVAQHSYPGSLRSVQRYYRRYYPAPKRRARRRVETPPGAQAQADWAHFRRIVVGGRERDLLAFDLQLSHSRFDAVVWSRSKDQLSWHHVHNEALERLGGVPAVVRVDNEKTAVSRGAGAWGEINESYRRYAISARFHIDACAPRSPEAKGKVERRIRDRRFWLDLRSRAWDSLEELQEHTDVTVLRSASRRVCPATGTSVLEAWEEEKRFLQPLPILPEPFDVAVTRRVSDDCLVSFEGRSYSVPFAYAGRRVEVRGCCGRVQVLGDGEVVQEHPRGTAERLVLDPSCYEGKDTERVLAPQPLGRMGSRLQEIWMMSPEQRPLDLYAALAEVSR